MRQINVSENGALACLIIPVGDTNLLIPNVSVAEILPWRRIKKWDAAPEWCLGLLGWRGETVPVIRYEKLNDAKSSAGAGRCLLIMNRTQGGESKDFYGLAVDGLPRLVRLTNDDFENRSEALQVADTVHLKVGLETATVPRLSYMEEQVNQLSAY